jgi:short-subunit dehydrogenase
LRPEKLLSNQFAAKKQVIKAVVISGISQELERAMVIEFAKHNFSVCACVRSSEKLASLPSEPGNAHTLSVSGYF